MKKCEVLFEVEVSIIFNSFEVEIDFKLIVEVKIEVCRDMTILTFMIYIYNVFSQQLLNDHPHSLGYSYN